MNSPIKFLRRVRIHGGECGAVARALHHKAKMSSLPAVNGNVLFTTNERNKMSKLSFKRIALVVVATLGLGIFSSGPSQSALVASSDTLTISATTSTIAAGETASVTVTQTGIGNAAGDSLLVRVTNQSKPESGDGSLGFYVTDSSNAAIRTTANTSSGPASATDFQSDYYGFTNGVGTAIGTNIFAAAGTLAGVSTATSFSATYSLRFMAPTVAGTYVFRLFAETGTVTATTAGYTPVATPLTWTVTVTANASDAATTASKFWLNGLDEYTATSRGATTTSNTYRGLEVDSALVVTAGAARAASAYTAVGVIYPVMMNSSDTKISTRTGGRVLESMTVLIAGAGQLSVHSRYTGLATAATRTYSKQVTLAYDETAVVYSDGTVGAGTLTAYVGASSTSANAVTQGTKTVTFTGRATTFTVSGYSAAIRAGSTVKYAGAADSATAGSEAFRFLATDAAGNAVTVATLNTDKGEAAFYAISSDTSVLAAGEAGATYATSSSRRSPALACTYDSTSSVKGYWYCTGRVFDSGTVTVTIVDSRDVTASGNVLTTTTGAVAKSTAFSITYAGAGNTGTIAFNKTSYNVNEAATLTLTTKDGAGRTPADGTAASNFTELSWKSAAPVFGENTSLNAAGGSFTNLVSYLGTAVYFQGTDTALVYMPTTAGTYTLVGKTGIETTTRDLLTITVTDPAQAAIKASADAATAAAEAATDAAAEAIDAANAATDAANLAAEAADAATVAAEEARDAADAATAAVEELASQVATLMAALKAQITTLANTVAKIAKKVKA
jgi:hypothetical protein